MNRLFIYLFLFIFFINIGGVFYTFGPLFGPVHNSGSVIRVLTTVDSLRFNTLRELMLKERFLLTGDREFIYISKKYEEKSIKCLTELEGISGLKKKEIKDFKKARLIFKKSFEKIQNRMQDTKKSTTLDVTVIQGQLKNIINLAESLVERASTLNEFHSESALADIDSGLHEKEAQKRDNLIWKYAGINTGLLVFFIISGVFIKKRSEKLKKCIQKQISSVVNNPARRLDIRQALFSDSAYQQEVIDFVNALNQVLDLLEHTQRFNEVKKQEFEERLKESQERTVQEKNKARESSRELLYVKEYYEGIVESITDGIIVIDDKNSVVSMNGIAKNYFSSQSETISIPNVSTEVYGTDFIDALAGIHGVAASNDKSKTTDKTKTTEKSKTTESSAFAEAVLCIKKVRENLVPQRFRTLIKNRHYDFKFYPVIKEYPLERKESGSERKHNGSERKENHSEKRKDIFERKYNGSIVVMEDKTSFMELEKRVNRVERLASLGQLSAGVAHEIKNPLAGMQVTTELLLEKMNPESNESKKIKAIQNEITRLDDIVNSLLDFARPSSMRGARCRPDRVLKKVFKFLEPSLKSKSIKGVVKEFEFINDRGEKKSLQRDALIDESSLQQVFLNIFNNSIEVMQENDVKNRFIIAGPADVNLLADPECDIFKIAISDTGPGVPDEIAERIFDPFFTSRPSGTGLGLSIIHNILTEAGGSIKLDTNHSDGACFIISLPLV